MNRTNVHSTSSKRCFGIDLFRCLMCIVVVCSHFLHNNEQPPLVLNEFQKTYALAVPFFVLVSFFLLSGQMNREDLLKRRIERLLVPQVFWSVVVFLAFFILNALDLSSKEVHLGDLFLQLITGHSYNTPMWFMVDLTIATVLFILLNRIFSRHFSVLCVIVIVLCFILQFSGVNYKLFNELRFEFRWPAGRLVEILPYSFAGYLLNRLKQAGRLSAKWYLILPALIVLIHYNYSFVFFDAVPSFTYAGVKLFIEAILLLILCINLPSIAESKVPNLFLSAVNIFSKYSMGIYIIHFFVGSVLLDITQKIEFDQLGIVISLLTVIISFTICLIIGRMPWKLAKIVVT